MINVSLKHLSLLHTADPVTNSVTVGCKQGWYKTWWQRFTGCGPSVVSTIMLYIGAEKMKANRAETPLRPAQCLALKEDVWNYVTPTIHGISDTEQFRRKASAFFQSRGLKIEADHLRIPPVSKPRPALGDVLSYMGEALLKMRRRFSEPPPGYGKAD
jgi:hypothetical protein